MNYGFIKPEIQKEHYVLGGGLVPFVEHQPDGNWEDSLPVKELQERNGVDPQNCTGEGLTSQAEAYMKKVYGVDVNYSARWVGIISGTQPPGNDPQTVYEAVRKYGLIPEEMLPFDDSVKTVSEYYSFPNEEVREACYRAGREWLSKYTFMHEWVFGDGHTWQERLNNLKVALKSSPIALAVYAWKMNAFGTYVKFADENHWTLCYSITQLQKIFDTYEPVLKNLDQEINFAKRIHIEKRVIPIIVPKKESTFIMWLKRFFHSVKFRLGSAITNNPEYIIVHHTGGTESDPKADTSSHTFEGVNVWHRQDPNVWLGRLSKLGYSIGYHYFIDKNGKITQGRADDEEGAHCKNYNKKSIGVCLAGNFDVTLPTKEQADTLRVFLTEKKAKWSIPVSKIVPHRTFANKSCFGKNLSESWARDLLAVVPVISSCSAEKDQIMELNKKVLWYEDIFKWIAERWS